MRVFNSDMTRSELLRRVGNLAQVGSVQLLAHEEGYARGTASWTFGPGAVSVFQFKLIGAWIRVMRNSTAHLSHGCRRRLFLRPLTGRTTITHGCVTFSAVYAIPPDS